MVVDLEQIRRGLDRQGARELPGAGRGGWRELLPVGLAVEQQFPREAEVRRARCAVVAAIVRQASRGAEVLLIQRAEDEGDPWSGHMALPGGHREEADCDIIATALRETQEEVGLDLAKDAEFLGSLDTARALGGSRPGLEIFPLVFALLRPVQPRPNPREVASIVWVQLGHLLSPAASTSIEHAVPGFEARRWPAFDVEGRVVWGLTHRILTNLLGIAGVVPLAR